MGEEGVCSALSENPASPGSDNDKAESLDCYSGCTSVVKIWSKSNGNRCGHTQKPWRQLPVLEVEPQFLVLPSGRSFFSAREEQWIFCHMEWETVLNRSIECANNHNRVKSSSILFSTDLVSAVFLLSSDTESLAFFLFFWKLPSITFPGSLSQQHLWMTHLCINSTVQFLTLQGAKSA